MKNQIFNRKRPLLFFATIFAFGLLALPGFALACDVSITKIDSVDPIFVGSNTLYTITITNKLNSAETVKVIDVMPAELEYVSGSASKAPTSMVDKTITWDSVKVAGKIGATTTITYLAKGVLVGTGTNKAKVTFSDWFVKEAFQATAVKALPICGDSLVNQPSEQCDGTTNGVVCTAPYDGTCTYCSLDCLIKTVTGPTCGDGVTNGTETCDAGLDNGKACTPVYGDSCSYCTAVCKPEIVKGPFCGDNLKNGSEECDGISGLGAHEICNLNCTKLQKTYCGNGTVEIPNDDGVNEECEGVSSAGCMVGGFNGTKTCNALSCAWSDCKVNPYCGNGQIDPGETCEGTLVPLGPHQTCVACSIVDLTYCGDLFIQNPNSDGLFEQCDNGPVNGTICTAPYGGKCNYCSLLCLDVPVIAPKCGDSVIDADYGELCDNGISNGVVCSATYGKTCSYCTNECKDGTVTGPYCGDGIQNGDEQCDGVAGLVDGQSCSGVCTIIYPARCGNGVIESGEVCDDGNTVNGDGCSSTCQTEIANADLTVCKLEDGDAIFETTIDRTLLANWMFSVSRVATGTEPIVGFITATTTESGCFTLNSISAGDYRITEVLQAGWQYLNPVDGIVTTTLAQGSTSTINFVNYRLGEISGNVYQDTDGNVGTTGDQSGLPVWLVTLYTGTSTVATTTSDEGGNYLFPNVMPGTYAVSQTLQSGWSQLAQPANPIVVLSGFKSNKNNFVNTTQITPPPPPPPPPPPGGCVSNCTPIVYNARLTVLKKADKSEVKPGEKLIRYQFTITNIGQATAQNVVAVDTLPAGFVFASSGLKINTWNVGTLAAGGSATYKYFVNATSSLSAGVYTNQVVVSYLSGDPVISTSNVTVKSQGRVLGVKLQDTGGDEGNKYNIISILIVMFVGSALYINKRFVAEL